MKLPRLFSVSAALVCVVATARAVPMPFNEEFNDDKSGWLGKTKAETFVEKIENGRLHLENLSAEANTLVWRTVNVEIELNRDFEIALRGKITDGPDDNQLGIIFDIDGNGRRRHFQVTRSGAYNIYFNDGKNFTGYRGWNKNPRIKRDEENELIVRVIGKRAFFLINGAAVDVIDFDGLQGKWSGCALESGVTAEVDHFHVRYLDGTPESHAAEARKLESEANAALMALGPKPENWAETFDDNKREWTNIKDGENWSAKIADGVLQWNNKRTDDGKQRTYAAGEINGYADYELSFRVRRVAGRDTTLYGIGWGWTHDYQSGFELGITGSSYFIFGYFEGGKWVTAVDWSQTSAIKKDGFNDVRVRKLGNTLFIVMNGQVVADAPAGRVLGDWMSLAISQGTTVAFDDVRVTYPKYTEEQSRAEAEKLVAVLKANHGKDGVVYSVAQKAWIAGAQARKDMQDIEDQRWKLTDADFKQLTKLRNKYEGKKITSVYADMGRPVFISEGNSAGCNVYYNYKLVGRTQYYVQFQVMKNGSTNPANWVVNAVQHDDKRW